LGTVLKILGSPKMGIFSFLKGKKQQFPKDSNWESKLEGVDFDLARDEIAYIFHIGVKGAEKKGKALCAKKEFVDAWEKYLAKPCMENAIGILKIAPIFLDIFDRCKPGGIRKLFKSPAVNKFGKSIIDTAHYCAESFKEELEQNLPTEKERHEKYCYIYFEFLYFIMHLTNRLLFGMVSHEALVRFNNFIGPLLVNVAVESIIVHWPQEFKENIIKEVFEKLNEAEGDYSESKDVIWDTDKALDGITGNSVLSKLTRTIAMLCGYEMVDYQGIPVTKNPADIMLVHLKVSELFINVMKNMKFESLVKELAKSI
jgi:hypothetical protein